MGSYTGSVELVNSQAVNGTTGAITVSSTVYSWLNGRLNGQIAKTSIVSCDCVLSTICCCVTPDIGGANVCFSSLTDSKAIAGGDICNTGGGPNNCPGSANLCVACNAAPLTRSTHSCLNTTGASAVRGTNCSNIVQQKVQSNPGGMCNCAGAACNGIGGTCNWITALNGCVVAPLEGC